MLADIGKERDNGRMRESRQRLGGETRLSPQQHPPNGAPFADHVSARAHLPRELQGKLPYAHVIPLICRNGVCGFAVQATVASAAACECAQLELA
jgi:hypothetical protein